MIAGSGNTGMEAGTGITTMVGSTGNNFFEVNNTADVVQAKAGGSDIIQTSASYTAVANVQSLQAVGSADLILTGNNDSAKFFITANSGNDTLVAGGAVAYLVGGVGNDTFVLNNTADVVQATAGNNINTIQTAVSYTAAANVQKLTGTGAASLTLMGNSVADVITANSGNDTLVAGTGVDTLVGGAGNDTFVVNNTSDVVQAAVGPNGINTIQSSVSYTAVANVQKLTGTGAASLTLKGNSLADVITANSGNDTMVAGTGVDTLVGGAGSDTFVVNNTSDVVQAKTGGPNTIQTAVSYTAAANVQNLTGTGAGNLTLMGNSLANVITANSGNDTLVAGTGVDTLVGGAGSDTFVVNNTGDVVQAKTGGTNTIQTAVSYTAAANVQNLTGTGIGSLTLTGNSLADVITANSGNDTLVAGTGVDTLVGGIGSDTFVVNNTGDVVQAAVGPNGTNTIQTAVSYTAAANVQKLTGTGAASLTLTGNSLADVITANSGNDTLVAGTGVDTLVGGIGSDTFVVNNTSDVVQAAVGPNGINTIQSSVSYTAAANVQKLTGTGAASLTLTGNSLADVITANSGNDTLVAGTGVDTRIGGAGSDTFVVNNASDVVQAQAGGVNTIQSSVNYTAAANVQNLTGTGTGNLTLTGNSLANVITANSGNDTLVAGTGVDTLVGGADSDTFVVNNTGDVVQAQAGGVNTIQSSVNYTAAANVQNLTGTGAGNLTLTGNNLADVITANSGNDTLVAGTGVDTLVGGAGSDTFVVNNTGDVVQAKTGGTNTIQSSVSYTAAANVQNLTGTGTGNLTLTANALNDVITSNIGIDTLVGGTGSDTFIVNNASDVVQAKTGGTNTIQTAVSYTAAANVQKLTGTGAASLTLTGNSLADVITANSGNDTLVAGTGVDTLVGGAGNDTFVVNNTGDVVQAQAGGVNTIQSSVSYTAAANVQNLTGTGTGNLTLTANALNDVITSNIGIDTLVGGTGSDTFIINNASDVVQAKTGGTNTIQTAVSYTAAANVQKLTGTGAASLTLTGNSLADVITANSGNDTLVAGTGVDTLIGGAGSDTFVFNNASDVVQAQAGGVNTIQSSVSYTAAANVQNLTGTGAGNLTLTGNNLADVITANSGNDTLVAGTGVATLVGGAGSDTFVVNNTSDVVQAKTGGTNTIQTAVSYTAAANVQKLTGTGAASLTLTGNSLADVITANSGNDTLVAGTGVDTLVGGIGRDTFVVDNTSDVVQAAVVPNGINTIQSSVSYTAAANVQNLTGTGTGSLTLTGNSLANVITANSGNDTLVAGTGVDTLVGGAGSDTFVVNNTGDVVQAKTGGTNTIQTAVSYTAAANVQNLTGTGIGSLTLTGNSLADVITANSGNGTLVAGTGVATLVGGAGSDTFVVNNTGDVVQAKTGGTNTIQTAVSYTAAANVQKLTGTGAASLTLTGNSLADVITANSGNDTLVAGTGVDTLVGGTGNDTFVVNNASDVVQATAGPNGINTIQSSVSYTAAANVQKLTGTGAASLTLTGNSLADVITANSGNDTLVAGTGVDTLIGGAGSDTFVLNNAVAATLQLGAGNNAVSGTNANVSLTEGNGTDSITLGNGNDQLVLGNGTNAVQLGSGTDKITLGSGTDAVSLGSGNDTVVIGGKVGDASDAGRDSLTLTTPSGTNKDTLSFTLANSNQLWFERVGNALDINIIGSNQHVDINSWFSGSGPTNTLVIAAADGKQLTLTSQVNALVSAMAAFAPPAAGSTTLPNNETAVQTAIAANWH